MKFFVVIIITLFLFINLITCLWPKFQATIRHKDSDKFLGILTLIRELFGIVPTGCLKDNFQPNNLYVILPNNSTRNITQVNHNECLGLTLLKFNKPLPLNDTLVKRIVTDNETIYEDGSKLFSYDHSCNTTNKNYVNLTERLIKKFNIDYCDTDSIYCDPPDDKNCPPRPLVCLHGILTHKKVTSWTDLFSYFLDLRQRCGEGIIRKTHSDIPYLYAIAYPNYKQVCQTVVGSWWLYADLQSANTQKWIKSVTKTDDF